MPLRVGVKYCGGCAPTYDRVEFFGRLRDLVGDDITFVSHDDPTVQTILVITGCQSACVDLTPFDGKTVFLVSDETHLEPVLKKLKGLTS